MCVLLRHIPKRKGQSDICISHSSSPGHTAGKDKGGRQEVKRPFFIKTRALGYEGFPNNRKHLGLLLVSWDLFQVHFSFLFSVGPDNSFCLFTFKLLFTNLPI
jgi:hypothetical protein